MMRSLYSGVSGLKTHQTRMDVIGNNIANVNTVGFKASSVTFSELFYQTTQIATGPNAENNTGGKNAKQIGLGTTLGSISVDMLSEGGSQSTGKPFDLKINGDSFFVVNNGMSNYFTKAGNFTTDGSGNLVTQSGAYVMGYAADYPGGPLQTDQLRALSVYSSKYMYTTPEATTYSTFSGNINQQDETFGNGDPITTYVSMYDNIGNKYDVQVKITQDATNKNLYTISAGDVMLDGKPVAGLTATIADTAGTQQLEFDPATGKLIGTEDPMMTLTITGSGSITTPVTLNFSDITQLASSSDIASTAGDTDAEGAGAGKGVGTMLSVGIDELGRIVASYSNDDSYVIGQLATATFVNPSGLEKMGDNLYAETMNSGHFDGIGQAVDTDGGSISSGVLEMSNVDLSTEFTDMIVTQRGFQANSRIITTSDTMLEELLNLKR